MLTLLIRVRRARAVLRVAFSGFRKRLGRVALSTVAVMLGVAFVTGVQALADTIDRSAQELLTESLRSGGAVVRSTSSQTSAGAVVRQTVPNEMVDTVANVDGVANVEGIVQGFGRLVGEDGRLLDPGVVPTIVFNWVADEELAMGKLANGEPPEREDQVVIDARTARDQGWKVGDELRIQGSTGVSRYEVSGIGSLGSGERSTGVRIVMMRTDEAQRFTGSDGQLSYLVVRPTDGVTPAELVAELSGHLPEGTEAITGSAFLAETSTQTSKTIDLATRFCQAFGLIGLVVAGLTIANSFSIVMTQRSREMALLRAAGATRRQVAAAALLEASAVGLIGSIAGVAAGYGAAWGAQRLVARIFTLENDLPVVSAWTILWGLGLGTFTTMLAAAVPAWRSSRVPPVEALTDAAIEARPISAWRKVTGVCLGLLGLVATASAWAQLLPRFGLAVFGAGSILMLLAVLLVGPWACPPAISALGALVRPLHRNSRLAVGDAKRHPKRTTATAVAMAVGLAVATMVVMVVSSLEGTATDTFKRKVSADLIIDGGLVNPLAGGIPESVYFRLSAVEDLKAMTRLRMVPATVFSRDLNGTTGDQFVAGVDSPAIMSLIDLDIVAGTPRSFETNGAAVAAPLAEREGWELGDAINISFPQAGTLTFRVGLIYRTQIPLASVLLPMQSIDQVSSQALRQDTQIYLSLYDADPDGQAVRQVEKVVAELSPASTVKPVDEWVDSGVDQVNNAVGVIYALLAFAILLSLFGIVNTLSLSMVERTNEIGLLRAVGLTRRQLIGQVVTEGALIAAFGAIIGVGIGLWIGAGLISITKDTTAIGLDVPWLTLLGLVVGAGLAGLLAAIVPAVRVGRLPIAEAIGR